MMIHIGMDQHKQFTVAAALNPETGQVIERRLEHDDPDRTLDGLATEIQREQKAIQATLKADDRAPILLSAPGVGELTAYLMLHEIGPIERFPGPKQFAKYCCVTPGTEESAGRRGRPGVGRAGNLYLKEAFTNAVLGAIKKDVAIRTYHNRQVRHNGKKKAKVATAHKLARAVYFMLTRRQAYRPARSVKRHVTRKTLAKKTTAGKPVPRLGRP